MPVRGWYARYAEILEEFGYARSADTGAARILDKIIKKPISDAVLDRLIRGKKILVVGAGPSLARALPIIRNLNGTKIIADSAIKAVLKAQIRPDIVVTDLDGDKTALQRAADLGAVMLVHAHGDNIGALGAAKTFPKAAATTQGRPVGRVCNHGGFTDGDRCVFLAEAFGAAKIILFGMDFAGKIGRHSSTSRQDRRVKAAKLQCARTLLEWLAQRSKSDLYTTSDPMKGFEKIGYGSLDSLA